MSAFRCPQCKGVIRADADWCGLCYADLRPPPPVIATVPTPAGPELAAFQVSPGLLDPLAPALGALDPDLEEAPAPTGWPCLECGTRNDFELSECAGCGIAFGAPLREPAPSLPGTRQTRLLAATGIVVLVMCAIALLSVLTGSDPGPQEPAGDLLVPVEVPAGQPVVPPSG